MPLFETDKTATETWLKILRVLIKAGIPKNRLARYLDIRFSHLQWWLKETYGISIFYAKVLTYIYSMAKQCMNNGVLNTKALDIKVTSRKREPIFRTLLDQYKPDRDTRSEQVYQTNRKILAEKQTACELCGRTDRRLECHHIITRWEAGWSTMVHHIRNLIMLCDECHRIMHDKKKIRDLLVQDRKLYYLKKAHGWSDTETN